MKTKNKYNSTDFWGFGLVSNLLGLMIGVVIGVFI